MRSVKRKRNSKIWMFISVYCNDDSFITDLKKLAFDGYGMINICMFFFTLSAFFLVYCIFLGNDRGILKDCVIDLLTTH